mgnify:FL=1
MLFRSFNFSVSEECILLHTVTCGIVDFIDLDIVADMKKELIEYFRSHLDKFSKLNEFASSKGDIDDKDVTLFDELFDNYCADNNTRASQELKLTLEKKRQGKSLKSN